MFNTKLKQQIGRLENRITELERQLIYYYLPKSVAGKYVCFYQAPTKLSAQEIMRRFDELYDHIGIEREIMPAMPEHPKLTKKKKASNAERKSSLIGGR